MAERERYRPLFKLDAGGMAEVYVAEAESMAGAGFKKKVAIKRILPGLIKDERFIRMFLDEARISMALNHANVVSVFDVGKSDTAYFIVMEYIAGTSLKGLVEKLHASGRRLPLPIVLWICNEVCKGLEYAHNLTHGETGAPLGIVHRDVSPPNVLVSWNGEVKLTDFGLAKASTQLETTDKGVVKGKFSYLAPEAAYGQEVDRRADVFAVGIMAWEMLAGRRLFLGETDFKTVEQVRECKVPALHEINPSIPSDLDPILRKALAREKGQRYQSAEDFGDAILGYLYGNNLKVGARDLAKLLAETKDAAPATVDLTTQSGENLISKLIDDELISFRSIDDNTSIVGAEPLETLAGAAQVADWDPSQPIGMEVGGETPRPGAASTQNSPLPATREAHSTHRQLEPVAAGVLQPAHVALTSPAPKRESSGGLIWAMVVLLLVGLGGGGGYWYLYMR